MHMKKQFDFSNYEEIVSESIYKKDMGGLLIMTVPLPCDFLDKIFIHIDFGREIDDSDILEVFKMNFIITETKNNKDLTVLINYPLSMSFLIETFKESEIFPDLGIIDLCIIDFMNLKNSFPRGKFYKAKNIFMFRKHFQIF